MSSLRGVVLAAFAIVPACILGEFEKVEKKAAVEAGGAARLINPSAL